MSDSEESFDEAAHEELLASINELGKCGAKRRSVSRKQLHRASTKDLVDAIHSTRNLQSLKKELQKKRDNCVGGLSQNTLETPLHRLARERVESAIAYRETSKDIKLWSSVVQKNRLADQISFPLEDEGAFVQQGTERKQNFKPRTPLEVEIARILGTTKNNLGNEDMYTEAEKELIKAMSLEEAKAKCAQLQKMRALISYREARLKRQAKIKSKTFHRHLKREKRRKLIKEFDELLLKDPDAAKEKLAEIDRQRILERATLKHRNGSKRVQLLARYAGKDPEAKKALEERIRLGRELVEKHGLNEDSNESSNEDEKMLTTQQLLEKAAELVSEDDILKTTATNPTLLDGLRKMRKKEKQENRKSALKAVSILNTSTVLIPPLSESEANNNMGWEEDKDWESTSVNDSNSKLTTTKKRDDVNDKKSTFCADETSSTTIEELQECFLNNSDVRRKRKSREEIPLSSKKKKKSKILKEGEVKSKICGFNGNCGSATIDALFNKVDEVVFDSVVKMAKETCRMDIASTNFSGAGSKNSGLNNSKIIDQEDANSCEEKLQKLIKITSNKSSNNVDISLDPDRFLEIETKALTQVPAELMEKFNGLDAQVEKETLFAEAFKDDDVIGSFEAEKSVIEKIEEEKDIDLSLAGWGSWTGPGFSNNRKESFVLKAKEKKRKDQGRYGVIISENMDNSIDKIQPRMVPFPYTTVEDYEAVISQPIGKEWNPISAFHDLTKPVILTKSGKIIKPLDKDSVLKSLVNEVSGKD